MNATANMSSTNGRPHDRRDSPRVPFRFRIRCARDDEPFEASQGNLSTGGVFWGTRHQAHSQQVEVRVAIPGEPREIQARGEIVGHREAGFHIRFTSLGTDDELTIARYIDEVGIGWE
jgi:PilZ domain